MNRNNLTKLAAGIWAGQCALLAWSRHDLAIIYWVAVGCAVFFGLSALLGFVPDATDERK